MMRALMVYGVLSVSSLFADLPKEVALNAMALGQSGALREVREIAYKDGAPCVGIYGIDKKGLKAWYIALRYQGDNGFKWTPLQSAPIDQRNDKFGFFKKNNKVVFIQSSTALNHENTAAFYVELDPRTFTVRFSLVEQNGRMPDENWLEL
jgi:hypothetical protein